MKYVRTRNGRIYEMTDDLCINQFNHIAYKERPYICKVIGENTEVIAQADTIEELCDEFVIVFEDEHIMTDLDYESFEKEWYKNNHIRMRNAKYYGAIWTSKGLQFVARMNDKGELELI